MNFQKKADYIRNEVIRVAIKNNMGHIAPSLSCVDILVALHYEVMAPEDSLIFSKAHGGYGLYAILADKGIISREEWENFSLPGCIERMPEYGIEAGCGALGHGLPMAAGAAFGKKLKKEKGFIYCLMGDGETQEGTTWESVQFAVKHELDNLIIIIDNNKLQAMDFRINILDKSYINLEDRFKGFGLNPWYCDRSDAVCLIRIFKRMLVNISKVPQILFVRTVKGHGLKCAENIPKFHYRVPNEQEYQLQLS